LSDENNGESLFRTEKDALGEMKVPKDAYFGIFTIRALNNFQISGLVIDEEFIRSLAQVKKAAARTNYELGYLDEENMKAIIMASDEIYDGKYSSNFKLDVFQAGAGTPYNMNINEVIANRANDILGKPLGSYKPIHPNDHVNMSQSSNDTIPTAMRITSLKLLSELEQELSFLVQSLEAKSLEFKDIYKSARTHTQDAVPVTLGQEFSSYSSMVKECGEKLIVTKPSLRKLPIGGTAVGTGVNTDPEYASRMAHNLSKVTELELTETENLFEKLQFTNDFTMLMNVLSILSSSLIKMCNDLMLLSSGPETGLKEINLPSVEPGSSIMPGKVNPSILECCNMVFMQVNGNRHVVETASQYGMFELNVYTPLIAYNLFTSLRWLTNAVRSLNYKCIQGVTVNETVEENYFKESNALATLLSPLVGYEKAAQLANRSKASGRTIEEIVIEDKFLSKEQLDILMKSSISPNMKIIKEIKRMSTKK
jgi:aspartate ammonia-lyase